MRAADERNAESAAARPEVQTVEVIGEFVDADIEPVKTKNAAGDVRLRASLIKKVKKLDKKAKPKKLIKALMADLESDLKKLKKKKK